MGRKLFGILRHAVTMVRRNLRSYAMLSVTIVISFSLLLGFLTLMDSDHYSDYKELFAKDRSVVVTWMPSAQNPISQSMAELMQEKASEYSNTNSTQMLTTSLRLDLHGYQLETGEQIMSDVIVVAVSLPRQSWALDVRYDSWQITWLDGLEHPNYDLKSGEILMEEQLFYALGLDKEDRTIDLDMFTNDLSRDDLLTREFTVVGTVDSGWDFEVKINTETNYAHITYGYDGYDIPCLVFSLEDMNPVISPDSTWRRYVIFYTDTPELVKEMIKAMDSSLWVDTVYEEQDSAMETIQTEKGTKAMVAMLLLLLLGINLYSSFDNALNDRKFEIGVKRAVGASAFSIVRQFFYEGLLVMAVDILLSVAIVADLAIVYKYIREAIPVDEWGTHIHYVLYISPYSIAIFVICALVLTVVFSFVFAYKSTQVQIVDYLKAE